jgi:hypothetical protein
MPDFLKGNYKIDVTIEDKADAADSTDEFEKKALSRLGGSICFVSKKSLIWQGEAQPGGGAAAGGEATTRIAGAAAGGEATTRTASRATPEDKGAAPAGHGDKDTAGGVGTKDRSGA